jgi:hypothetical protein
MARSATTPLSLQTRLQFGEILMGRIHIFTTRNVILCGKNKTHKADNRPPSAVSFMPAIASTSKLTSGRLHSEFVRLLFLQAHRETDPFLQLQEFSQRNLPVDSFTFAARLSLRA